MEADNILNEMALDYAKQFDERMQADMRSHAKYIVHSSLCTANEKLNNVSSYGYHTPWQVRQKYVQLFVEMLKQEIEAVDPDAYVGTTLVHDEKKARVPGYEEIKMPRKDDMKTYVGKGAS